MHPVLPSNYDGILRWKQNIVTIPANSTTLLAKANSSRIWIMFANATSPVPIFLRTDPKGIFGGVPITASQPLIFRWDTDGLAPTLDWYVAVSGGPYPYIFWEQFYTET